MRIAMIAQVAASPRSSVVEDVQLQTTRYGQVPRDQPILPDMVQDNMYIARVPLRFDAEKPKRHEGRKKGVLETLRHAAKRLDQHLRNSCLPQTSIPTTGNSPCQ